MVQQIRTEIQGIQLKWPNWLLDIYTPVVSASTQWESADSIKSQLDQLRSP